MPTAYLLARDKVEQARSILESDVWKDEAVSMLLDRLAQRLENLDTPTLDAKDRRLDQVVTFAPPHAK